MLLLVYVAYQVKRAAYVLVLCFVCCKIRHAVLFCAQPNNPLPMFIIFFCALSEEGRVLSLRVQLPFAFHVSIEIKLMYNG